MDKKRVELMAPLKNYKSLNAIIGKTDAVYFGVESLNMRMFSDNFKLDDMQDIVKKCHDNNIHAYLTTNIVIYENELVLLEQILDKAVEAEIDAVIVHDIGAIQMVREKDLKFHISTQANISNSQSAKFYESEGAQRLILARELSLEQIKEIREKVNKSEIETFVHGAQCTSISGRCYFSAETCQSQDYSANRGKCVQPCRRRWWVYDDQNNELLYDGVFFIRGPGICEGKEIEGMNIMDIFPTVLSMFSLPIPAGLDGVVQDEIFAREDVEYTKDEADILRKRLEALGYA